MDRVFPRLFFAAVTAALLFIPAARARQQQQKPKEREKSVRKDIQNFDGGIFFETDGGLSDLTCFRLAGRVTARDFFDNFRRIDDQHGTEYRRGQEILTEFPKELHVSFVILDIPCPSQLQQPGPRRYLSQEMMKALRFSFYWKRGIELRHIENPKEVSAMAEPIEPYNAQSKEGLPKRYRWFLEYTVPSAGVPLTDRLVLIVRGPGGQKAARVAARL